MDKEELKIEKEYLQNTIAIINESLETSDSFVDHLQTNFNSENENYLKQMRGMNLNEMGDETVNELDFQQRNLENLTNQINENIKLKDIYSKMKKEPYFARIDLKLEDNSSNEKYYIGVHSVMDDKSKEFKVLDWRSPIAGLFYDYDAGEAFIKTDTENTPCYLLNKRQYKIEDGNLEYFFDTNVTIDDEILKTALAKSTTTKMKSIVQTIQKEQNKIIRCNENTSLLVQGIAGSGKTAIALHRIAFLLYKLKGKIKSKNIAMLSPNNAFSTYISQVLPDLAEEDIKKVQLDYTLMNELKKFAIVEEKYEQVERVINFGSDDFILKTSYKFYKKLSDFCLKNITNTFNCKDFEINGLKINGAEINRLYYKSYDEQGVFTRICWICEHIVTEFFYRIKVPSRIRVIKQELFSILYKMINKRNCVSLYLDFLKEENLKLELVGKKVKNEDAYAILFIRIFTYGAERFGNIEHLVIDEIQDYSPIQLYIINYLFNCTKTMLGDFKQSLLNVDFDKKLDEFKSIFGEKINFVSLNKTYRPTIQIAKLFNFVGNITGGSVVGREGDEPILLIENEQSKIVDKVLNNLKELKKVYQSVAVITKNNIDAQFLYSKLKDKIEVQLIDDSKDDYENSICVLSAFASKGMEFDAVVIYDCSDKNFNTELENNLLYIALSRALHKIVLLSKGEPNKKIDKYFKTKERA